MSSQPMTMPSTGATKMNRPILTRPHTPRPLVPALLRAAPAKPATRAWLLLVGSPAHQVSRSHTIAPRRPAVTTGSVIASGCTTPRPIVLATWVSKMRKATKLKKAAQITAWKGRSTRVLTTVAMEFAASWKPFTKSNDRARAMMPQATSDSGMLEHDRIEDVGHVFTAVGGRLDLLVEILPLDDLDRVVAVGEQLRQGRLHDPVGVVLLRLDGDALLVDALAVLHVAQQVHGFDDQPGGVVEAAGQPQRLGRGLPHPVDHHAVHAGVDQVDDVVDPAGELVDVLAVDRRDEGAVEPVDDLVRDLVAGVLDVLDALGALLEVVEALEQLDEEPGALVRVAGGALEELEEVLLLGHEPGHGWIRAARSPPRPSRLRSGRMRPPRASW